MNRLIPNPADRRLVLPRRSFIKQGSMLSATAIALLSGCGTLAAQSATDDSGTAADVDILNSALNAEREAIAAYQLGAESGLLTKPTLAVALQFQGHHKAHADVLAGVPETDDWFVADVLAGTVGKLGGAPAEPPAAYDLPTETLKSEIDVLRFAAGLERGAVTAYLNAVPLLGNRDLARAAASILGDEAMHWAVLRQALGEDPVPGAFV